MTAKLDKVPFEDALNMTGFSKFNLYLLILSGGIITGMVFEIFSVAYLVPASACELSTTSAQQGMMAGMPLVGIIAFSHIWGYLADTRGRKKILVYSMMLGFFTGALATLSPNWIVYCILKLLSSSAVSGSYALSMAFLGESTPAARRNMMIILTSTVYMSCQGIMAAITIPVLPLTFSYYIPFLDIHFNSWRLLNLIFSIPCIISSFGLMFAYESPKYLLSSGDHDGAMDILRKMFMINTGKSGDLYLVNSVVLDEDNGMKEIKGFWSSVVAQTVPLMKPPLLWNTFIISLIFVIVYICFNPYMVWLPFIADGVIRALQDGTEGLTFCEMIRYSQNATISGQVENKCGLNDVAMSMVFSIGIFMAVLNSIMGAMVNYLGRKNLLIAIQVVSGVAGLCVNATTSWILSAILFIIYVSGVINFGFLSTFSVDVFPTYVKAMAVCLTLMVGRASAVLGINLLKDLLDTNCEASFYIFGGITILGGVIAFLLPSDRAIIKQKKCPET
ncbi:synaptic vesicle glycoprotein 2B-like [Plodia interpunctella]|uniref:synaptic vesicle glycoprotein 2B-like n=1 Tax=Plodia interpunctella TaxID=58824 RepID=UPI002367D494|nr:synaptic vesicle glycoprotein 2B-like [Plodia interpunctella]